MTQKDDEVATFLQLQDTIAVILGGGRGSRLWPLTGERAKPAVPLGGRYRLVDVPLSNCIHSGLRRIFVLTQFNSGSLNRHVNNSYKFDNFSGGFVEILAAEQTDIEGESWFQGTADAIRKQLRHITSHKAQNYVVLAGDHLYRMDYRELMATHLRNNADITVATLPVARETASGFGIMKAAPNGRIEEFVEKPSTNEQLDELVSPPQIRVRFGLGEDDPRKYLASMGVYICKSEVLISILKEHPEWIDFGHHIIPNSLQRYRVYAHPFLGFWEDIGTVRSYYEISLSLTKSDPPFEFHDPDKPTFTRPRFLPGSRLHGASVHDAIICEGCKISQASITRSIIGIRTTVHPGVTIEHSILMGADYYEENIQRKHPFGIGANTHISNAIVDKNARIGQNVVIQGSPELEDDSGPGWAIRDGIVIILKAALIPDGTEIGAPKAVK